MEEQEAIFILKSTSGQSRVVVNRSGVIIGRTQDNNIVLADSQISRRHMRIFWQDGNFWIEDLGSTNGVWLNDERLAAEQPTRLAIDDKITAGPFTLILDRIVTIRDTAGAYPPPIGLETFTGERSGIVDEYIQGAAPPSIAMSPPPPPPPGHYLDVVNLVPHIELQPHRFPDGIPDVRSNWLSYLPAIYANEDLDPTGFMGRYLTIFESILSPIMWTIDSFGLFLTPKTAPEDWLQWIGSWFDLLLVPNLPEERQREIINELGWLFFRRGTKIGMERLLTLYFGVTVTITDRIDDRPYQFFVEIPLSKLPSEQRLDKELAHQLIDSQKPAFTTYELVTT